MLDEKVSELANVRKDLEFAKKNLAEMESRMMSTSIGEQVLAMQMAVKFLAEQEKSIRDQLDSVALQIYANENDKHPHGAVTIKENNRLVYYPPDAIQWALKLEQMEMINLNKTAFEKAAKVLDLEFVEKRKEPSVAVSSDLSAYIETTGVE